MSRSKSIIGTLAIIGGIVAATVYAQTIPDVEQLRETLSPFINENIEDEELADFLVEFLDVNEVDDAPLPAVGNAEVKDVEPPEDTDPIDSTDDPPARFTIPAGTLENLNTLFMLNKGQDYVTEPDYNAFQVFFTRVDWDYILEYADVGGSLEVQVDPDRDGDELDNDESEDQFVRAGRARGLRDVRYRAAGNTSTIFNLDGTSALLNAEHPGSDVCNEIAQVSYITELDEVITEDEDLPDKIYPDMTAFHESGSILYTVPTAYDLADIFEFDTEPLFNPVTLVLPPGERTVRGVENNLEDEVVITIEPGSQVQVFFIGSECFAAIDVQEGSVTINTVDSISTIVQNECLVIRPDGTVSVAQDCEDALPPGPVVVIVPPTSPAPTPTLPPVCNYCIDGNGNIQDEFGNIIEYSGGRALNVTPGCEVVEYSGGPRKFCPGVRDPNICVPNASGLGCPDTP